MKSVFDLNRLGVWKYFVYGSILAVVQLLIGYYVDGRGSFYASVTSMLFGWHYIPEGLSFFIFSFFLQRIVSSKVSEECISRKVGEYLVRMAIGMIIFFISALFIFYYRWSLFVLPIHVGLAISFLLGLVIARRCLRNE